ncbi:helicase [Coemansia brasiliensis]|uniref:RNA helicase n=1 Tax=Coemansia brasiliensis TaxID=2650707 RepID=A0A9W8IFM3_9FUNG|nr:helicase [Coemansia brasiliensis]
MGTKSKKAGAAQGEAKFKKAGAVQDEAKARKTAATEPATDSSSPAQALFGKWTGKTPVTLLNEFVQKNAGWQRVDYQMHGGSSSGFHCIVRLSKVDKKQPNSPLSVIYKPEATDSMPSKHSTSLEARHMAATFVLHRLRSDTNLHRMLPPVHRSYWLELETMRKQGASSQWIFTNDPFAAKQAQAKMKEEQKSKQIKQQERMARAEAGHKEELLRPAQRKRWEEMAEVHMSDRHRHDVEEVVRRWTKKWGVSEPQSEDDKLKVKEDLIKQGFREAHVEEALIYAKGLDQARDWLCVHVPEDDLPEQFMRRTHGASATVVINSSANAQHSKLSMQLAAKRVARAGFSASTCEKTVQQMLDSQEGSVSLNAAEAWAAFTLVNQLCGRSTTLPVAGNKSGSNEVQQAIDEEAQMVDSIYADEKRVDRSSEFKITVALKPIDAQLCPSDVQLVLWVPPGVEYPEQQAAVTVMSDQIPAYLKLHATQQLNTQLSGDGLPVLFEAVNIAEQMLEQWLANPPPLTKLLQEMSLDSTQNTSQSAQPNTKTSASRSQHKLQKQQDTKRLCAEFAQRQSLPEYQKMQKARASLPAAMQKERIVQLVDSSRCVVVAGATGSGKTTQIPQFILDAALQQGTYANIICTQPRRISAIGVATRVAAERAEDVNSSRMGAVVGYAVRGESRQTRDTRLLFCTTGVLLRMLAEDPDLTSVTHVICDEVHERSVDADLLLVLLRRCLERNKQLRIVLMSATAQCGVFAEYFGASVPSVTISGRTFPVDDIYVEDFVAGLTETQLADVFGAAHIGKARERLNSAPRIAQGDSNRAEPARAWLKHKQQLEIRGCGELQAACVASWNERFSEPTQIDTNMVGAVIGYIDATAAPEQAVLLFVPGVAEIHACIEAVRRAVSNAYVLPLHAGLTPAEQQRVFARPSRPDQRKVIVATNIAETSITIDDIGFVVDCGRVREVRYDHVTRVARLVTAFCSRAAATQRQGRAGRIQRGKCYRIYTRFTEEHEMPQQATPEILRLPLEQVCLQTKALGHADSQAFLQDALDPPPALAVRSAESLLVSMGACQYPQGPLLALGQLMSEIPLDLRLAKTLLLGAIFNLHERALRLVSLMALDRPLFAAGSSLDQREAVRNMRIRCAPAMALSDWLADLAVFERCLRDDMPAGVSRVALREAKSSVKQLRRCLDRLGLAPDKSADGDMDEGQQLNVLRAVLLAGLSPNIARVRVPQLKYQEVAHGTVSVDREARELSFYAVDAVGKDGACWQDHDLRTDRRVFVHPQSIMFTESKYPVPFVAYLSQSSNGTKTYLRDVTVPPLYGLLMFGPQLLVDHDYKVIGIGESGGLAVRAWPRIGVLVGHLRRLLDELLRRKLADPNLSIAGHPIITTVLSLIKTEGR